MIPRLRQRSDGSEGRPRVLLVDDEEQILSALVRSLRREGYELLSAQSPRQALHLLKQSERIDLVLTDHKMPGMSGLELLKKAAQLQPHAARLLITGWSKAVSEREIQLHGIAAVIPKPWEDGELKAAMRRALH